MPKLSRFVPKMGTILPVLGIATFVAGCATPYQHWLTDEEDADLRAKCEFAQCVMVPGEIWLKVMQALRGDQRI